MEVDHVIPIFRGGEVYDPGNLQCLCRHCHIEKTRRETRRPRTTPELAWDALVSKKIPVLSKV